MEKNGKNNGENSGPLTSLPVDRLTATDCNAAARANYLCNKDQCRLSQIIDYYRAINCQAQQQPIQHVIQHHQYHVKPMLCSAQYYRYGYTTPQYSTSLEFLYNNYLTIMASENYFTVTTSQKLLHYIFTSQEIPRQNYFTRITSLILLPQNLFTTITSLSRLHKNCFTRITSLALIRWNYFTRSSSLTLLRQKFFTNTTSLEVLHYN